MSVLEAAVWCIWGGVVVAVARMLIGAAKHRALAASVAALLAEVAAGQVVAAKAAERIKVLESDVVSIKNRQESNVRPIRSKWGG